MISFNVPFTECYNQLRFFFLFFFFFIAPQLFHCRLLPNRWVWFVCDTYAPIINWSLQSKKYLFEISVSNNLCLECFLWTFEWNLHFSFLCSKKYFSALVWCVNTVLWTLVQFFLYFHVFTLFFLYLINKMRWTGSKMGMCCIEWCLQTSGIL